MTTSITIDMAFEKSTKNTHVYSAKPLGSPPPVKTLYIEKWALGTEPPREIIVTVTSK